jgi:multiple sugar transport system permease protein
MKIRIPLKKKHMADFIFAVFRTVIILGLCYIILYPFFMKIANSFKSYADFIDPTVRFIPKSFTLDNIRRTMDKISYFETLLNTTVISVVVGLVSTFISSFAGYGFARYKFKGKGLLFFGVIFTLIVPPQTVIIPLFVQFKDFLGIWNLLGTIFPVLILALTGLSLKNGLYIFMLRQFYKNMPKELEEAAYLDGCGAMGTYFRIMLPSAKTMLLTIFLLSMAWQWTDMLYNPLFFQEFKLFSSVFSLAASGESNIMGANMTSIATLLAVLPLALIYIIAQRFFVQSVERTGIVG